MVAENLPLRHLLRIMSVSGIHHESGGELMSGDYDLILVTARCSRCGRTVSASYGELRTSGVFECVCGTMTRARYSAPDAQTPFSHAGWRSSADSYHRSNWR
jgi:hypothetical protein